MFVLFALASLAALIFGLKLILSTFWGKMGLRRGALVAFFGYGLFFSALLLGVLAVQTYQSGWQWDYLQAVFLYPPLLVVALLFAFFEYIRRSYLRWWRNRTVPRMAWWESSELDIPD